MEQGLLVNGLSMTGLTPITKFMPHLPLAFLGQPPQRGLVICFGMGTSFRSMHSWGIDTTAVELVPSVPAFFARLPSRRGPGCSRRRARTWSWTTAGASSTAPSSSTTSIVIDPPPPVEAAGSSLLYSREFYAAMRPHLAPDGIVQAWIPGGEPRVVASFVLALRDVFPYVRAFPSVEGWGLHLLASGQPIASRTAAELAALMPAAAQAGPRRVGAPRDAGRAARRRPPARTGRWTGRR